MTDNAFDSDIVMKIRPPSKEEVKKMKTSSSLFSFIQPG